MIGRKIVDRIDDLLDGPSTSPTPSCRYSRPPPLRIDTPRCPRAKTVLDGHTNTTLVIPNDIIIVSAPMSARSLHTPNTSLTFGVPNPTTYYYPTHVESPCGSASEASPRSYRYSVAEQALASALKNSEEERSPLELQISSLQQATATLSTRARESRERVARLKLALMERDVDPEMYTALQRERWMGEKRQSVADKEVEILTRLLARLQGDQGPEDQNSNKTENHALSPALFNEAKRSANLARFLDYSPTRTSFDLDLKCRLSLDQPFPRRITMSDVSPLRLRPSSFTPPLRRLTTKHTRPPSMAAEAFNPVKRPRKPRPTNSSFSDAPPLTKSTENSSPISHSVTARSLSSRSSRLTSEVHSESDGSEGRLSSTPPLSLASESSSSQGMGEETSTVGMATIISRVTTSRTRSEILADLDKDAVHVPDYAVNLLGELDRIHDKFSLPDREFFSKPREMKPIEVAPPPEPLGFARPSEESDTGPYTSFALPPFTVEPSWSHSSLHSPSLPSSPHMHRPSLQQLTPDSSSFSRSSTPTTPRPSQSSKNPRPSHSLLFYMRKKQRGSSGEYSPASSSVGMESLSRNGPVPGSPVPKKRFSFFSRK